jgi:alpha-1,2-mannosyltransferase
MTAFVDSVAKWLTPRRLRAQAIMLALCLWAVCAFDYATPGLFDHAGNIKFQDFLQFPIAANLISQGRSTELYNDQPLADGIRSIVGRPTNVYLQYFYGPQVALAFLPLRRFSFLTQAEIFVALSLAIYFLCIYLLCRACPSLRPHRTLIFLCAAAYPPLFHFFVRGQLSAVVLLCFTAAGLAFLSRRDWLAGIALGCLAFKPQFLVAIPLLLLLARQRKIFAGLTISAGAQIAFTYFYFGPDVMPSYLDMLIHSASRPGATELSLSPIQMHSLYSFWELLIPGPGVIAKSALWILYLLASFAVIAIAAAIWKSSTSRSLEFSALILAAVLVNPHIYIYDLLALTPVFLLIAGALAGQTQPAPSSSLTVFLYLSFILPLLGPLSRWTHLQLSVPVFAALLLVLWRNSARFTTTAGHKFAPTESRVV